MIDLSMYLDPEMATQEYEYELVCPGEELPDLEQYKVISIDVETTPAPKYKGIKKAALNPWRSELLGIAIGVPGRAWYIPLRHAAPGSQNLDAKIVGEWLQATLNETNRLFINHNIKFDMKNLALAGIHIPRSYDLWCTWVGSVLMDERVFPQRLKTLSEHYLNMKASEEAILKKYLKDAGSREDYSVIPVDIMAPYACGDVERAIRLAALQKGSLEVQELTKLHREVERPLTRTLFDMEMAGIRVDVPALITDAEKHQNELIAVEARLEQVSKISFNPNSTEELADLVTTHLGLPILEYTKPTKYKPHGGPSFGDGAMLKYMEKYPEHAELFWCVRKARRLGHILTGFIAPYIEWQVDGIIHCNFNQVGTRTGRLSASDPNLQQVPHEQEWTFQDETWTAPGARKYFIPREGYVFLAPDYSQVEYRIFAHYTNSERMIRAYQEDASLDMHQWCATDILGGRLPRKKAKNVNLAILYNMSEKKLIKQMSDEEQPITEIEGREILQMYHTAIPELKPLQKGVGDALKERGYIKTLFGRRRRIDPDWRKRKWGEKPKGLLPYQALNSLCQGSAADVLKERTVAVDKSLEGSDGILLLTIHDELFIEVPENQYKSYAIEIKEVMEDVPACRVPLYVDVELITTNWANKEAL